MFFRRKEKNRRLSRGHVLDVKLRSDQVRAVRMRLATVLGGAAFGLVFGIYLLWRLGGWALDLLVYENRTFAITQIEAQTDGVIAPDQLRRWSGVRLGENLLALDLAKVKRNLEMVPQVGNVSVERVLPRTVRLRVTERTPVAQVNVPQAKPRGGLEVAVFQLDTDGFVVVPLDPRQRTTPLSKKDDALPVLTGVNVADLQPGKRVETPQVQAALELISEFECSPMAGLVDLKRIDVASPEILVATTAQGGEVTFGLENLDWQLRRWREVYERGKSLNKAIATLDLAVTNNVPARWMEASAAQSPLPKPPKPTPTRNRRHNV